MLRPIRALYYLHRQTQQSHWKHRFPEYEEQLLTTYYNYKGWNYDGVPTRERLEELDLAYVADELEKRGVLKNGQDNKEN